MTDPDPRCVYVHPMRCDYLRSTHVWSDRGHTFMEPTPPTPDPRSAGNEPQTQAGRRLYGWLRVIASGEMSPPLETGRLAILAIEAEAARPVPSAHRIEAELFWWRHLAEGLIERGLAMFPDGAWLYVDAGTIKLNRDTVEAFSAALARAQQDIEARSARLDAAVALFEQEPLAVVEARPAPSALVVALRDMVSHDAEQRDMCGDWGTDECTYRLKAEAALAAEATDD